MKTTHTPWYRSRKNAWILVGVGFLFWLAGIFGEGAYSRAANQATPSEVTWVMTEIKKGNATDARYVESTRTLSVSLEDGETYSAVLPANYIETATSALVRENVSLEVLRSPDSIPVSETGKAAEDVTFWASSSVGEWAGKLGNLGLALMLIGAIVSFMSNRKPRSARVNAGKAEEAEIPTTLFADVAGCDEAIEDLKEMVELLRDPSRFEKVGATMPKGALLCGPPGTGKTLLARAVAGEAGVPFFSVSGSDFVEQYVGVGAKRVRELFNKARKSERAIIFIDEVDAVARKRGNGESSGAAAEQESTLIALLTEMDGFQGSNIIVLAATNRPDVLDPALVRPGRLDRRVEVPLPDRAGREAILKVHARGRSIDPQMDMTRLARRTPGFSGAQLKSLVNEACIEAVRRNLDTVTLPCFDSAVATLAMGRARHSALVTEHDRKVTAWHEAGHTIAALLTEADDPVQVSIVPRGPAGGVTWMSGSDDMFLSRVKAKARLVVAMGGRVAEELLLDGEHTQGASGDLSAATDQAIAMVSSYGMTSLGLMVRTKTGPEVEKAVEELLQDAYREATMLLSAHKVFLERVANALLEHEDLTLEEVKALAVEPEVEKAPEKQVLVTTPAPVADGGTRVSLPRQRVGGSLVARVLGKRSRLT